MWLVYILFCFYCWIPSEAHLYPYESESRQVKNLNGIWLFKHGSAGFEAKWYDKDFSNYGDYTLMPVPSSFNEVIGLPELKDYVGWVWYQNTFFLNKMWSDSRVFVYFGAVDHYAVVWCNGVEIGRHKGGHVPFHLEVPSVKLGKQNFLTVAVNNTLTPYSLPQGYYSYPNDSSKYPPGSFTYKHNCDYFDYAGINRNVFLYSVPKVYIEDINVVAGYNSIENKYSLKYDIKINNNLPANCTIVIKDSGEVTSIFGCKNDLDLMIVRPWTPELGNLVAFEVTAEHGSTIDVYRMNIGFRNIEWKDSNFLKINGEKFYLKGFGMHEDSDLRGRGYDDVTVLRDINLLTWLKANAIRTSHYPYSEEFLLQCDFWGITVILEVPACSIDSFSEELFSEHERVTLEVIAKYKHHPSIIMWSLANEPASDKNDSTEYFKRLYETARTADPTRPITFVTSQSVKHEKAIGVMDCILINRYNGWYQNGGKLDLIKYGVKQEVKAWNDMFKKPVIISEYGAGALTNLHELVPSMWTEDYQVNLLQKHFEAYDDLRSAGLLSGEMIWNLIDFKTPQEYFRPGFCMKGIFTRQREPKTAANIVRQRYMFLANKDYSVSKIN